MQAILYCDKRTECIPLQNCPEALLPLCNVPLLEYLLQYIQQKGFRKTVLLAVDERIRHLIDGLHFTMPIDYANSLEAIHADMPTLLLRKLCVPDWDFGELFTLCHQGAVKLFHSDSTPTFAELHPRGSILIEPEQTATTEISLFRHIHTPAEYRKIQQELLLSSPKLKRSRIGAGTILPENSFADELTIIGNDCLIGEHVNISGCCIGDGVQIGNDVNLKNSVICRKSFLSEGTHLENTAVPEKAMLCSDTLAPEKRRNRILSHDGICEGLPEWNTAETALKAGSALTSVSGKIAIGYFQEESEIFAETAACGAVSHGANVWFAGNCALSQLIHFGEKFSCPVLFWVHGEKKIQLQPFNRGGFPLTEQQAHRIWQAMEADTFRQRFPSGKLHHAEEGLSLWEESCQKLLPPFHQEITVSCANQALRQTAQELFSGGTGKRMTLSLSEDGTKATVFTAETGMIRHEQLLLLSLLSFQEMQQPLILPENFHPMAEQFATEQHAKISRVSSFSEKNAALYRKQGVCMDGVKLFLHFLRVLHLKQYTPEQAIALLPELCTVQHEFHTSLTRQKIEHLQQENSDQRIFLSMPADSRFLTLRAHANSLETAAELCGFWEKKLQSLESQH